MNSMPSSLFSKGVRNKAVKGILTMATNSIRSRPPFALAKRLLPASERRVQKTRAPVSIK